MRETSNAIPGPVVAPAVDVAAEQHARRTLILSGLAVFVTFLDSTVLFVAFPDISRTFAEAGPAELSWVLNAYTIAFAALLVPAGKIADRIGHKRVFLGGSIAFTVASVACAVAPTVEVLIAFRVVQAIGAAALIPASLALVLRAFPSDRLPVAVAVWGSMGALAGAVGPTLGSILVELSSWRLVFLINLPAGIVTVVLGRRVLRESSDPETKIPAAAGIVSIAGAAALASLAVVQSDTWGWLDPRTTGCFAAAGILFAGFLLHQRRTTAPALDLSLFAVRNYAWANAAMFAFGIAFTAMFFGSFLFLTNVWGYSVVKAGLGISPGPLVVALFARRFGSLAGRIGQRPLLLLGGVVFAGGGALRLVQLGAEPDYLFDYAPSILLTGLGVALVLPQLTSIAAQSLPANRAGVGGAVSQAIRQFGGTLGVALTLAFVAAPEGIDDALARFDRVWALLVVGGLATTILCLPLRTRHEPATLAPVDDLAIAPELA